MATFTKIQEGSKGRLDQTQLGVGKNQFVRASDFNSQADVLNAIIPTSNTAKFDSISESTALADVTINSAIIQKHATAAINSTATATAAQVKTGYITSTSAAATSITLPTGTLLGAALGAAQGTIHNLFIDNTAGANTVTLVVAVNGILSAGAAAVAASFGLLTVPSGVTGIGRFTLVFSSATAYVVTRTA